MAAMNGTNVSERMAAVKVRLSDSAVLAGAVSLLYAIVLMAFPRTFPELVKHIFYGGYFFRTVAVLLLGANEMLFLFLCQKRGNRVNLVTSGYIAGLTITMVFALRALVVLANEHALLAHLSLPIPSREGIGTEELLLYTHLGLISGIVGPFLMVRLTQNSVSQPDSTQFPAKSRSMAAGQ